MMCLSKTLVVIVLSTT